MLIGPLRAAKDRRLAAPVVRAARSYQWVMQCAPNPQLTTIFDAVLISNRQIVCRSGPRIETESADDSTHRLLLPGASLPPAGVAGETLTHWMHTASCMIMAALLLTKEGCQLGLRPPPRSPSLPASHPAGPATSCLHAPSSRTSQTINPLAASTVPFFQHPRLPALRNQSIQPCRQ